MIRFLVIQHLYKEYNSLSSMYPNFISLQVGFECVTLSKAIAKSMQIDIKD